MTRRDPGTPETLSRAIVALKAQLAESERARGALRKALEGIRADAEAAGPAGTCGLAFSLSDDALAADQTTARESAENTAEETMTDCKPPANVTNSDLAPAQPPEPVEPSDEEAAYRVWDTPMRPKTGYDGFIAGYRAGLAAEAAKHEKAEVELGEMLQVAERARDDAKAELERVRAELTEHQREFERGELESRMSGLSWRP